jgi:hypothetical protein
METKHKIVLDAYIYGYPLVTMDLVRKHETNVRQPDGAHAPMGQLIKLRSYPPVDDHAAAAPNADTLYTMVWLDVSNEPWVFSIPEMGDRFYIMPMLSGFNEVFFVATRATGSAAQEYLITGPAGQVRCLTASRRSRRPPAWWILGRVYCEGTRRTTTAVHDVQDRFTSVALSGTKRTTPAAGRRRRVVRHGDGRPTRSITCLWRNSSRTSPSCSRPTRPSPRTRRSSRR